MKTKNTIEINKKQLSEILAKHFNIDSKISLEFEIDQDGCVDDGDYTIDVKTITITYNNTEE